MLGVTVHDYRITVEPLQDTREVCKQAVPLWMFENWFAVLRGKDDVQVEAAE
jgi:hypothetical protein